MAESLVDAVFKEIESRLPIADCFEQYQSSYEPELPYYHIKVRNYLVFYVVIQEAIGLSAVCIFRNYVVVISIGTGIFSSALCMFVYEIINAVRYKKEVINDFKDIAQQVQTYYCCTNQCKKAVKTFPESEIVLRKNALAVESYNTILLGNMLIINIEKLKHNYQPCLSNNSLITLNDISEAIRDNMRFISNASSNVTTEFNDYWIISESVKNSLDRLQQIIRVERSIFYEM